jgi:hypothetical protein
LSGTGGRTAAGALYGFAVEPVDVNAVLLGIGERYDVLVTLADGVFGLWPGRNGPSRQANEGRSPRVWCLSAREIVPVDR